MALTILRRRPLEPAREPEPVTAVETSAARIAHLIESGQRQIVRREDLRAMVDATTL
jgi:hypothetical protein